MDTQRVPARRHLTAFAALCAAVLIASAVGLTYESVRAPFELARTRWAALGGADYSLVVTHWCGCGSSADPSGGPTGIYHITVQSGRVTGVEALDHYGGEPIHITIPPAEFDSLTVEAMLRRAAADQPDPWPLPWLVRPRIEYDPAYGFVTAYVEAPIGWNGHAASRASYSYFAGHLELEK